MCILSTLSALNSIENYYYHIEFRMDSMHIGTQASSHYFTKNTHYLFCLINSFTRSFLNSFYRSRRAICVPANIYKEGFVDKEKLL